MRSVRAAVSVFSALVLGALGAVQASASASTSRATLVDGATALGMSCSNVTTTDGVQYAKCTGELPTFDGIGIDTDLSIPLSAAAPRQTILMLHGWGGDKSSWEADSRDGDGNADKYHWNNVWFVSRGWVVVNYTARGFGDSCGQYDPDPNCATGWTHLADRDFEGRDAETILGLLVDAGIADAARLVSTGGSYGGGQTWLVATSKPWTTPGGVHGVQLAAAVPKYPWTDLIYSLVPNGRQTDDADQSRSHTNPVGIPKESYIDLLYAGGRAVGGRYNTVDPLDAGSALDRDYERVQQGEPYDNDPTIEQIIRAFKDKSAYYYEPYFDAVSSGAIAEVPVLSISGWTDPLFPAGETLQMFRKLKAADPNYPIYMAFGDVGHSNAANPLGQWEYLNTLGNRFLDREALGRAVAAPPQATAFVTHCQADDGSFVVEPPLRGTWDELARGEVVAVGRGTRVTTSGTSDPDDGSATDPVSNGGCLKESNGTGDQASGVWSWDLGTRTRTLLGLPELTVHYDMVGEDATIAMKLWDVAPDGTKTLFSRDAYRIGTSAGDPARGVLRTETFGNAWRFEPGHTIQLQITQNDSPYLRSDNLQSTITWFRPVLTMPTREGGTVHVVAA